MTDDTMNLQTLVERTSMQILREIASFAEQRLMDMVRQPDPRGLWRKE